MLQRSNCYLQPSSYVLEHAVRTPGPQKRTPAEEAKDFGRFYAFFTPRVQS